MNNTNFSENQINESDLTLQPKPVQQTREIRTMDEMEQYIDELSSSANTSVAAALSAQLAIINHVSSPNLVDSAFDLVFKNLQDSLTYAETNEDKEQMRGLVKLMIHNYIFFQNAKLEFAKEKNREVGAKLLGDAAKDLLKSSVSVINVAQQKMGEFGITKDLSAKTFFTGSGIASIESDKSNISSANLAKGVAVIYGALVVKDFVDRITQEGGVWDRFVNWFTEKYKNKRKYNEFLITVDGLFHKLEKYKSVIGKSNIMSDVIERYSISISELKNNEFRKSAKSRNWLKIPLFLCTSFFASIIFISQATSSLLSSFVKNQDDTQWSYAWVGLAVFYGLGYLWLSFPKIMYNIKVKKDKKRYQELADSFLEPM